MTTTSISQPTQTATSERAFRRSLETAILRCFFLSYSLEKAVPRSDELSATEDSALLEDLASLESEMQNIHEGAFIPEVLTIACKQSRNWELDLLETLSSKTDHWDAVLRLTFELEAIASMLQELCKNRRASENLAQWKKRIQGHLAFQLKILGTWINTEEKHGRPALKVVEISKSEVEAAWPKVVSAVIGNECVEKEPAANQILHAIPELGTAIVRSVVGKRRHA